MLLVQICVALAPLLDQSQFEFENSCVLTVSLAAYVSRDSTRKLGSRPRLATCWHGAA
jgi:hypothetical protein